MKGSAFMAWENKGDNLIELNSNKANKPIIIYLNSSIRNTTIKENICFLKHNLGLAIKAAELQGNKTGRQFLSKIQEGYFIYNNDFFNEEILMEYAELTDLDLDEFANDIF